LAMFAAYVGGLLADRLGPKIASLVLIPVYAVCLIVFALTRNIVATLISLVIITFAQAYLVPVVLAFVPKRFPQSELGGAFGIIISIAYIAGAIGPLLVGQVADNYGFTAAFLTLALCPAIMGVLIFRKL